MTFGLIADTHGLFRPDVSKAFSGVELIIHAGDVGGGSVLDALSRIAPVEAVSGNVDDRSNPMLPRQRWLPVDGMTLHVSHGDELGSPTPRGLLDRYAGDILVFGHTHRATVHREGKRLVVNPGSAGPRRFNLPASVARLTVEAGRVEVEIISL